MFDHSFSVGDDSKIQEYIQLLKRYNEDVNIYSKGSYDKLNYHVMDSRVLASIIGDDSVVVDFGSGSGLPAVVLAICNGSRVICVESKEKKRQFLTHVKNALKLNNLRVFNGDVQLFTKSYSGRRIDVFTAKAFAKPPKLLRYLTMVRGHSLSDGAKCLVPISENQKIHLESYSEIVVKSVDGMSFYYLVIDMANRKSYRERLENQYNL